MNMWIRIVQLLLCCNLILCCVFFSSGNTAKAQGKSYPLCPCCYSQPPVFLTAEEMQRIEQNSGRGSVGVGNGDALSAGVQVSACAAKALRDNATSNGTISGTVDVAEQLPQSIDSLSLDATSLLIPAALTLNDIEEHKGVKIRRRVKVAAKNNYFDPSVDQNVPKDGPVLAPSEAFADPLVALMNNELPSPPTTHSIAKSAMRENANTALAHTAPLSSGHLPLLAHVPTTEPIRNPRRDRSKVGAGSKVNWIKDTVSGNKQGTVTYGTVGGFASEACAVSSTTAGVSTTTSVEPTVTTSAGALVKTNTSTSISTLVDITDSVSAGAQRRERPRPGAGGRVNRANSTTVTSSAGTSSVTVLEEKPHVNAEVSAVETIPSTVITAVERSSTPASVSQENKKVKEGKGLYHAKDARSRRQQTANKNTTDSAAVNVDTPALEESVQSNNVCEAVEETNHVTAPVDSTELQDTNLSLAVSNNITVSADITAKNDTTTAAATSTVDITTMSTLLTPPMVQPIEEATEHMGCNSCLHPFCPHSATMNRICECPGDDIYGQPCTGSLILDVNSKPNWKLACNKIHCNTLIRFRGEIHDITPQPHFPCPECGITTAIFEFNKLRSPLPNGATTCVGCVVCNEFLNSITEVVAGRAKNLRLVRQERYKRGGMMGGRGRGRGRGGRVRDVKMSFSDF